MFLICGYDGVHVCGPMAISACFKLIVIQVQIHFKRSSLILSSLMFCDFAVLFYIFMLILLLFIIVIIAFTLSCLCFFFFLIFIHLCCVGSQLQHSGFSLVVDMTH